MVVEGASGFENPSGPLGLWQLCLRSTVICCFNFFPTLRELSNFITAKTKEGSHCLRVVLDLLSYVIHTESCFHTFLTFVLFNKGGYWLPQQASRLF